MHCTSCTSRCSLPLLCLQYLSCPIHTVVLTQAENVACMLAAQGTKGYRAAFPHARLKMSATRANREFGPTVDIMIHANELQARVASACSALGCLIGVSQLVG